MTEREALKLALDWFCCYSDKSMSRNNQETLAEEAITAIKEALMSGTDGAQPEQKPVAWPKTPAEISDMIGSSYVWREHKISDVEPHESDKYCVTAHDLLESFENWNEYTTQPQRKPLTDEQRDAIARQAAENDWHDYEVIDAVEAAHGIKGEA